MTGCRFANSAAGGGHVNYVHQLDELTEADVVQLDTFIDEAGAEGNFAVVLLPRVRTPRGIVRLLRTLATGDRWRAARVPWRRHPREGAALVGLHFKTVHGDESSVMGFAPLGCMPVTRRAPYVALAVWAGAKSNSFKPSPEGSIGFVDAPVLAKDDTPVTEGAHQVMWSATLERVKLLLGDPPEDDFKLKDVAFCLPEVNVAELFPGA
ncbi:MAG: hypothetical protein U0270_02230 [Labilithrix sp.]